MGIDKDAISATPGRITHPETSNPQTIAMSNVPEPTQQSPLAPRVESRWNGWPANYAKPVQPQYRDQPYTYKQPFRPYQEYDTLPQLIPQVLNPEPWQPAPGALHNHAQPAQASQGPGSAQAIHQQSQLQTKTQPTTQPQAAPVAPVQPVPHPQGQAYLQYPVQYQTPYQQFPADHWDQMELGVRQEKDAKPRRPNVTAPKVTKRLRMGCLTCRQRKKRCCESKPKCSECLRLRLNCVWPKPGTERKNKPKEVKSQENMIDHFVYGKIKVLRGIVEYRSN